MSYHSATSIKGEQSPHKTSSFDILGDMIREKELIINLRVHIQNIKFDKIKKVEEELENRMFKMDNGCIKCCDILKRMKSSILSYKGYL